MGFCLLNILCLCIAIIVEKVIKIGMLIAHHQCECVCFESRVDIEIKQEDDEEEEEELNRMRFIIFILNAV